MEKDSSTKILLENAKLNDFFKLGRYTYVIILLVSLIALNQLSNQFFMMYAGKIKDFFEKVNPNPLKLSNVYVGYLPLPQMPQISDLKTYPKETSNMYSKAYPKSFPIMSPFSIFFGFLRCRTKHRLLWIP